jgi:hypothetical protein
MWLDLKKTSVTVAGLGNLSEAILICCSIYWGTFTARDTLEFLRNCCINKEMSLQYIGHILALL